MSGMPTHDGLWIDVEGDIWVVDVCRDAATLVHDGVSWLAQEDHQTIDAIDPYKPFVPIYVPGVDDQEPTRMLRREQDRQAKEDDR